MTKGYISESGRKTYTLWTIIWSAVVFFLQLIIPMIIIGITVMVSMLSMFSNMEVYTFNAAAPYRDGIVTVRDGMRGFGQFEKELVVVYPDRTEPLFTLPDGKIFIERYEQDIWCFTKPVLYHYDGQDWQVVTNTVKWEPIVDVRAIDGGIIVWTRTPDDENCYWSYFAGCWIKLPERLSEWKSYDQHVEWDGKKYHVAWEDGALYSSCNSTGAWNEIGEVSRSAAEDWTVCSLTSGLYVIAMQPGRDMKPLVARYRGTGWEKLKVPGMPGIISSAVALPGSNGVNIVSSFMPGTLSWYRFDGTCIERISRQGRPFFPSWMIGFSMLVQVAVMIFPLALVWIITVLMRRYRTADYIAETGDVYYAPLIRRAFATMMDYAIVCVPLYSILIVMAIKFNLFDYEKLINNFMIFPLIMVMCLAMFVLGIAVLVVWSFLEGRYGRTPGKWLLGIRVVSADTLRPCGFWRALARNFLRIVDGMFNYMIGIVMIALSEHHQRIGDLAAGTVVIREERSGGKTG